MSSIPDGSDRLAVWRYELADEYTRKYLEAQTSVICERSGRMVLDIVALYREVNEARARAVLPPIEVPDYYRDAAEDWDE